MGGVEERSDLKLLDGEPEDPVFGDALDALKAIPARQRSISVQMRDRRRCYVDVNVHRLVAVIVDGLCGH